MSLLKELESLPSTCIYHLTDGNHIALYYSCNALVEVVKHVEDLRRGLHDCPELNDAFKSGTLRLGIDMTFDYNTEQCILRAHYGRLIEDYKARAFVDLRPNFKAGVFRLKQEVKVDYRNEEGEKHNAPLLYVLAVSNRNDKYVMAIFTSRPEADEWIKDNIDNTENLIPTFHTNELTKGYHERYALKLR